MRPTKRTTALHFNDLTPPGTTESHRKDGKTQLLDHNRTTSKAVGSLDFDLDKFLVDDTFAVTSVKSLLWHVSTSFRINSKTRSSAASAWAFGFLISRYQIFAFGKNATNLQHFS